MIERESAKPRDKVFAFFFTNLEAEFDKVTSGEQCKEWKSTEG